MQKGNHDAGKEKKHMNRGRSTVPERTILLIAGCLVLFSLLAPPILYETQIRQHEPSGMHLHILIITGITGCILFCLIAFGLFLLMGIPTIVIFRNSPTRNDILSVEIMISCIIAFILWWPNVSQF